MRSEEWGMRNYGIACRWWFFCRGDRWSPVSCLPNLRYPPYYFLHFSIHVGDGALDVPNLVICTFLRYPHNVRRIFSKHHTAQRFPHGTSTQICDKTTLGYSPNGTSRAPSPTPNFYRRKIASLFADFTLRRKQQKRCSFVLRYLFVWWLNLYFFFPSLHRLVGCRRMRLCLKLR